MVILNKKSFLLFTVVSAASVLFLGWKGYSLISAAAGMSSDDIKFNAENIFFLAVILATVLIIMFAFVTLRSRSITKELDRLIALNSMNSTSIKQGIRRLGPLGKQLNILYRQLNDISEKRGLKISAVNAVNEFLVLNFQKPFLLLDITGRIIQASKGYIESSGRTRTEILNSGIGNIYNDIKFIHIISELEKKHIPVETEEGSARIKWIPVHNRNNEISYIIAVPADAEIHLPSFKTGGGQDSILTKTGRAKFFSFFRQGRKNG